MNRKEFFDDSAQSLRAAFRGLIFSVTLLGSAVAGATALGDLASQMKPGEWRVLNQGGDASGWGKTLLNTGSDNILNYADKALWNPNTREIHYLGKGCCGQAFRFITYNEASNQWSQEAKPFWDRSPSGSTYGHGYEHSTLSAQNGDVFWREYNSNDVFRWTRSTKVWSQLPAAPNPEVAIAIEYFPEAGGIVMAGNGRVHHFRESTGTWTQIATGLPMGGYHNVASYNPVHKVVLVGGGNGNNRLFKINAALGVQAIAPSPVGVGILDSILTVDPVSGKYLLFGSGRTFHEYDVASNIWTALSTASVPIFAPENNRIVYRVAVPVSSHGVIVFLTYYWDDPSAKVYVYKHAPGSSAPPDTTPPSPPGGVTVAAP